MTSGTNLKKTPHCFLDSLYLVNYIPFKLSNCQQNKVSVVNSRICSEILKHSLGTFAFTRISSAYILAKIIRALPRMANSFLRKNSRKHLNHANSILHLLGCSQKWQGLPQRLAVARVYTVIWNWEFHSKIERTYFVSKHHKIARNHHPFPARKITMIKLIEYYYRNLSISVWFWMSETGYFPDDFFKNRSLCNG